MSDVESRLSMGVLSVALPFPGAGAGLFLLPAILERGVSQEKAEALQSADSLLLNLQYLFVTPDAERTMQTYLGVSVDLGPDDIDPEAIGAAQITYLEGYLFDKEPAKEAFVKAAELAHAAGRKVAGVMLRRGRDGTSFAWSKQEMPA